jgi:hypothetical protein
MVVDRVADRLAGSAAIRARTRAAVAGLQQRLRADYAELARHMGLEGGTASCGG